MSQRNEIDLAKIGHIGTAIAELQGRRLGLDQQINELELERSQLFLGLSKSKANIRTGRKVHRAHEPRLDPVAPGIQSALDSANRVRVARRRAGT